MTSGIYKITLGERDYIGSSSNIEKRYRRHLYELKYDRHHNIFMQRIYNKYKDIDISLEIIEETDKDLLEREKFWILKLCPSLNIGSVGGGDNLTNNPNREKIIEKMTASVKVRYAKMSTEDKKRIYGRPGESNPNWRGGTSKSYCKCGAEKALNAKTCIKCRDRTGENNPFFGKSHTEETKKKLREVNAGRLPPNCMKVICEGKEFVSMSAAAKEYGINPSAMSYRLKSDLPQWSEFYKVI